MAKQAIPSEVKVLFHEEPSKVDLIIKDNGVSFDPNEIQPDHCGVGFMQERVEGIGVKIKSSINLVKARWFN